MVINLWNQRNENAVTVPANDYAATWADNGLDSFDFGVFPLWVLMENVGKEAQIGTQEMCLLCGNRYYSLGFDRKTERVIMSNQGIDITESQSEVIGANT